MTLAIGFDIGGSTIRGGIVDRDGDAAVPLLAEASEKLAPADARTPERLVARLAEVVAILEAQGGGRIDHVGIGIAAQMSADGRTALGSPNLFQRDVPLADLVEAALPGKRIAIANDLNAILLGEARFGAARGVRDAVALYCGTGLGGAALVGGALVQGARGVAGEIGHVWRGGDLLCGCGARGCLETIVGGKFLSETFRLRVGEWLTPDAIDARARAGDPAASALWGEVCDALADAAAALVSFLNPELLLLGGGVLTRAPYLVARLQEEIPRRSASVCREGLRIELGALGEAAGLLGAASL
jgi:glucokinase